MNRSLERISNVQKRVNSGLTNRRKFMNTIMRKIFIKEYQNMPIDAYCIKNDFFKHNMT